MKKIFYVLVLVGAVVFSGCNNDVQTPSGDNTKLWPAGEDGSDLLGFIDSKGKMVISAKYSDAYSFCCGWACVREDGEAKYIDKNGKKGKFPSVDTYYNYFYYNRVSFKDDKLMGKFDNECNKVVKAKYDFLGTTADNGYCFFCEEGESVYGYLDRDGKEVIKDQFDYAATFNKGICVVGEKKNNERRYGLINSKGEYILDPSTKILSNLGEGRVASYSPTSGKCIMIDKNGEEYGESYEDIDPFSCGLALVEKNDKCGFINTKGDEVIELSFAIASDFSDNVAWVKTKADADSRFALIDKKGNELFTLNRNESPAGLYHNGLCLIYNTDKDKYLYIDKAGEEVYSWKFKTAGLAPSRNLREISIRSMAETENAVLFMERQHGLRLTPKGEVEYAF